MLNLAAKDRRDERVVILPFGSVLVHFTPSLTGQLELLVEPGVIAFPDEFERHSEGARTVAGRGGARRWRPASLNVARGR